jgi:hypothetical protein
MNDELYCNPFYSTVEEAQTFQLLSPSLHVMQPMPTNCMPHRLHVGTVTGVLMFLIDSAICW